MLLGRRLLPRLMCIGLVSAPLAGCGVVPMLAQTTTSAAVTPFTTAAQAVGTDLQIVGHGVAVLNAQAAQSRQIAAYARAQMPAQAPVNTAQPSPVSYQMPTGTNSQAKASKKTDQSAAMDILPHDVLKRLTPDQVGLQRAAQKAAMTAVVGETIFWHLDGREGTAMTETESVMGSFTCRTFVQTLALEDTFEKASVKACHTRDGAWTQSF